MSTPSGARSTDGPTGHAAPKSMRGAGSEQGEQRRIVGRAGIVAAGTLASRVLGLGRELVLAAVFTRRETDAFFTAFLIPNLLRQLLAEGAVQTGVLPVLAATRERDGDEAARRLFDKLRGLSLLALALVSVAGVWGAPWLVLLFAEGFRDHPGQFEETVKLTRWVFPYIFFMGSAALGLAALNTFGRFVVTAFAPALLNVSFILCGLTLPALLVLEGHDRTLALAIGVWLGGVLQVVAQWPSLHAIGMLKKPELDISDPGVREVLRRLGPATLGIAVYYLDVMVGRHLLSGLEIGATSYFNFALRLCDFPQGIFIMALQAATLPSLTRLAAVGESREFGKTFAFGMRLSLFVALPATVLFVVLAEPLVVLIFQRGQFDAIASAETAKALAAQGLGIWTVAAVRQLVTAHYALGDTRTPALVAAADFVVFVLLALSLRPVFGHVGISLAVSGSSLAQMLLLWWRLADRDIDTSGVVRSGAATLFASAPAAAAAWAAVRLTGGTVAALGRALPGLLASLTFVVVFLLSARLLGHKELALLWGAVRRRAR